MSESDDVGDCGRTDNSDGIDNADEVDTKRTVSVTLEPVPDHSPEKPYAEVRRVGKFRYAVTIEHAPQITADPWIVWGHDRAIKKGVKQLRKYVKWLDRRSKREKIVL